MSNGVECTVRKLVLHGLPRCSNGVNRDTQDMLKGLILSLKVWHVSTFSLPKSVVKGRAIEYDTICLSKETTTCDFISKPCGRTTDLIHLPIFAKLAVWC